MKNRMKYKNILLLSLLTISSITIQGCKEEKENVVDGYNYFYNQEATGQISNPGMGWSGIEETIYYGQVEAGGSGNIPEVDVISIESNWAFLEPSKDAFDFSLIDKTISYWKQYNKHFILRIMTDALSLGFTWEGCPQWLLNDPRCGYEVVSFTESHPGRVNDEYICAKIDSEYYKERLGIFLEKLAERYGPDSSVDVVEIRGYGNWGEWHSGYSFDTISDRTSALNSVIDIYKNAYANYGKILALSNTYDPKLVNYYNGNYNAYITASSLDYAFKQDNITYRRDSVGSSIFKDEYEGKLISDVVRSGKKVPQFAEFYWSADDMASASDDSWNFENSVNHMLFKARPNTASVIGYNPYAVADMVDANQSWALDRGNSKLGYRFVVDCARVNDKVSPGDSLSIMIRLSNRGVGRFYFDDKIKYYITNSKGEVITTKVDNQNDIRNIMLGDSNEYYESIKLPDNLNEGKYYLSMAIVDSNENPHISLAIEGDTQSKIYQIASFEVKKGSSKVNSLETKMTYDELKNYSFESNSVYTLTFGYTPKFKLSDYEFGNYDGYVVKLKSSSANSNRTLLKFQDVSEEYGSKTITFNTGNPKDYQLVIESENFGDIDIGDIYLRKESNSNTVNFDTSSKVKMEGIDSNAESSISSEKIHGQSLTLNSNILGDGDCAYLSGITLKKDTYYNVTFNTKTIKDVGIGGYMYASLDGENVLEWYERPDTPYTNKSFTFKTGSGENKLCFGCHNRGSYSIDDITIVECPVGTNNNVYDYGFARNVRPSYEDKMGETEGFEGISFLKSICSWGYYRFGRITTDSSKVISGNQSFWGILDEQKLSDYMELMYSNSNYVRFERNKTYKVEFDYRVLKNPVKESTGEKGYFYTLFRSDNNPIDGDIGWNVFTDNDIGTIKHYSSTVTIADEDDYKFIFGQYYYGEIIIDNLKFTKIE